MQNEIEETQSFRQKCEEIYQTPEILKKYVNPSNYSKPNADFKGRSSTNLKENLPAYILFSAAISSFFCIRNLKCFFFFASWAAYIFFKESNKTFHIKEMEVNSSHILLFTVFGNLIYLMIFSSILVDIVLLSLFLSCSILCHSVFYDEMKDKFENLPEI